MANENNKGSNCLCTGDIKDWIYKNFSLKLLLHISSNEMKQQS